MLRQLAADQLVQPRRRAVALDQQLGEAAEIENAHALPHRLAFLAHGIMPVSAVEAQHLLALILRPREPGGALPAAAGAEHGALGFQPFVQRCGLGRAAGRTLLGGVADGILVLIELDCLRHHVLLRRVVGVAPGIEDPEIPFRLAMGDPFRHRLAAAARLRDAKAEAAALKEIREAVGRADIGIAVGRIGNRPVDDFLHADGAEDRHALDGVVDVGLQPFQIVGVELIGEFLGNAVDPVGRRLPLIGPEQQAAALLPQIVAGIGIAKQRQLLLAALEFRDRFGHEILMGHGDDRHVLTDHGHDLTGAITGGVDHIFAGDIALVGLHQPFARLGAFQPGDAGEAGDLRAHVAGALGIGLGELAGIDVAVERIPQAALEIMQLDEGIALLDIGRRQQLELQPLGAGHAAHMGILLHARLGVREADRSRDVIVHGIVDLFAQLRVKLGAVALELQHVP